MNKKIMILGASILQLPAIQKAKEMGLQVVAVDMNPDAVGFKENGIYKEIISTIDISKVVEAAKRHRINGVMTLASDMPMRTVAAVAKELHLVGIDEITALRATNKAEMRKALAEHHVPIPKFYKVSNEKEYIEATRIFKEPFITKPADNSGSRGIFKVEDIENLQVLHNAYEYSRAFSRNGDVIVEEYMSGPEVSVETLAVNGKCHVIQITDKLTTGAPHFVEIGHSQPTRLSDTVAEKIKTVAVSANQAIGISNGPSHTEIIVTSEGPKVVELGARLGGDCITTHLVPLSTGIDMVECCIKIALGEEPDFSGKVNAGSAIRYFEQHAGIVHKIAGVDTVKSISGVISVEIVHGVGEKITEIENSGSRMGFVIAQRDTAENAIQKCLEAIKKIDIEVI